MHFEATLRNQESPGLKMVNNVDIPLMRDVTKNYEDLEVVLAALIQGCIFGKQCIYPSKEPRKCFYSAIAITDCFLVSFHKNDIFKMIDN